MHVSTLVPRSSVSGARKRRKLKIFRTATCTLWRLTCHVEPHSKALKITAQNDILIPQHVARQARPTVFLQLTFCVTHAVSISPLWLCVEQSSNFHVISISPEEGRTAAQGLNRLGRRPRVEMLCFSGRKKPVVPVLECERTVWYFLLCSCSVSTCILMLRKKLK